MSNLKVLSWLEVLNTGQGCFQIPQYSLFCKTVIKSINGASSVHTSLHCWFMQLSCGWGSLNVYMCLYPSTVVPRGEPGSCESGWSKAPPQPVSLSQLHSVYFRISCLLNTFLFFNSASGRYIKKSVEAGHGGPRL